MVPKEQPIEAIEAISGLGALNAAERSEYWASLALRHTKDLGTRSHKYLLDTFGSAYEAVKNTKSWEKAKVNQEKARRLETDAWRITAIQEWNIARHFKGHILLWTDPRYPELLRQIPDPPCVLYCQGDMSLLQNPAFAIVGTRLCSSEGLRATNLIVHALSQAGITIISGMALGIDRAAHAAAVHNIGSTIAVLGAGHGVPYPRRNLDIHKEVKQHGLTLSEYAPHTPPDTHNFPIRNRIISGLSLGVLVVEAALKSGSLITARLALEQNRIVYAIPGAVGMETALGCQELIRQGAQPVFDPSDILRDLAGQLQSIAGNPPRKAQIDAEPLLTLPKDLEKTTGTKKKRASSEIIPEKVVETKPKKIIPLLDDPIQRKVFEALQQKRMDSDGLCQCLDLPPQDVSTALVMLEITGHVARQQDNTYIPENA